ncbi:MAG TPA: SufE family protein [Thermoanaerobaculia bacterium]|nr:SufE family protein [Thermoanaerobaculia bacterium]
MSAELAPAALAETVDLLESLGRGERIDALISIAERFRGVPERLARRPYEPERRVPGCESEAYVWSEPLPDGALDFHVAVENPQGVSAKAFAVILCEALSGAPVEEVLAVPESVVERIFGRELSMGKSLGLTGMLQSIQREARASSQGQRSPSAERSGGGQG